VNDTLGAFLTTKELAELLRIKERKVYDLASSGEVPCTRATGKLLFPREAIQSWLAAHHSGPSQPHEVSVPAVFLGSHDPLLEWALRESECGIPTHFESSADGIERFTAYQGLACGLHIKNGSQGWNTELVRSSCAGMPVVLLEWSKRQRGLIYSDKLRPALRTIEQITECAVTPRQTGAGAQTLLLDLLQERGIDANEVNWRAAVRTENDAALAVSEGKSDVAFGLESLAQQYRLQFLPVIKERFDLLMSRRAYFDTPMQTLIAFCQTERFKARAAELAGYDISAQGTVHFNGP